MRVKDRLEQVERFVEEKVEAAHEQGIDVIVFKIDQFAGEFRVTTDAVRNWGTYRHLSRVKYPEAVEYIENVGKIRVDVNKFVEEYVSNGESSSEG